MNRQNREFLLVLALLVAMAFASGYALGTYDGAHYAFEAAYGVQK
jgi:hypothetical protein